MKNLKTRMITFGSFLMFSHSCLAAEGKPAPLPEICKSAVGYVAAFLKTSFYDDGDPASKKTNSLSLDLEKDKYLLNTKVLGDCDGGLDQTHPQWCKVAGGNPTAFEVQVSEGSDKKAGHPVATVVVVYNRGGCTVQTVSRTEK